MNIDTCRTELASEREWYASKSKDEGFKHIYTIFVYRTFYPKFSMPLATTHKLKYISTQLIFIFSNHHFATFFYVNFHISVHIDNCNWFSAAQKKMFCSLSVQLDATLVGKKSSRKNLFEKYFDKTLQKNENQFIVIEKKLFNLIQWCET